MFFMKVYEGSNYTTHCGIFSEWDDLKLKFEDSDSVSVLDLRTVSELSGQTLEDLPEAWSYSRLPLQGSTISEQDVDLFRREQRRHGKMLVLAENEARGCLLALVDLARKDRSEFGSDGLDGLGGLDSEQDLLTWLEAYLSRHKSTDEIGES